MEGRIDMGETRLKREIALGSIINLITILVGLGVGWGMMTQWSMATTDTINQLRAAIHQETLNRRDAMQSLEARLRALEASDARSDERFTHILQALGRIEVRLDRAEAEQERERQGAGHGSR